MRTFVTSFCNFPHNLATGRPVEHECYVLPVSALLAEKYGRFDDANRILATVDFKRKGMVRGGKPRDLPPTRSQLQYLRRMSALNAKILAGERKLGDADIACIPSILKQLVNKGWATATGDTYTRYEWNRPMGTLHNGFITKEGEAIVEKYRNYRFNDKGQLELKPGIEEPGNR